MTDAIEEILQARQKRAEHIHERVLLAREAIRKHLEPDSPDWLRAAFDELHAIHHALGGDPFDMHMRAALAASKEGWRSMESAPKDKFVLLWCEEDRSCWLAKWQGDEWHGVDDEGLSRKGYSAGDPNVVTGWAVNLWRPLPAPPLNLENPNERG